MRVIESIDPYTGLTDSQMRDPRYFCWELMVEAESCVHCMFGNEAEMFFVCTRCHPNATKESGPWTWGFRGHCIKCMGMATNPYSDIETHVIFLDITYDWGTLHDVSIP